MRIISKFHDYYDSARGLDLEQAPIYIRKTEEFEWSWSDESERLYYFWERSYSKSLYIKSGVIGFAGKIHKYCTYEWSYPYTDEPPQKLFSEKRDVLWSPLTNYYNERYKGVDFLVKRSFRKEQQKINQWYDREDKKFTNIFNKYNTAIFHIKPGNLVGTDCKLIINPILKNLEFYKILPPAQAYQELSMWVNNIAEPRKEIPAIDDKTMAEIKGFDKYSFRKDKT